MVFRDSCGGLLIVDQNTLGFCELQWARLLVKSWRLGVTRLYTTGGG